MSKRIPHPRAADAAVGIVQMAVKGKLTLDKAARLIDRTTRLGQMQYEAEWLHRQLARLGDGDPTVAAFWRKSVLNRKGVNG